MENPFWAWLLRTLDIAYVDLLIGYLQHKWQVCAKTYRADCGDLSGKKLFEQ